MRLHGGERDRVPYGKEITRVTKRVLIFVYSNQSREL